MTDNHTELCERLRNGPTRVGYARRAADLIEQQAASIQQQAKQLAGYAEQHGRDSAGLRRLCAERDEAKTRIQQQALEYVSLFDQCSEHLARIADLEKERDALKADAERLNAIVNTPQSGDFLRAVSIEAEHQRQRWGSSHDAGKAPADWFWLVGYLGGKALHAHASGNIEKAEHHIITTAAACENWHKNMFGKTDMRPGIDGEAALQAEKEAR